MIALAEPSLVARWHRRFSRSHRNRVQPRPLAALGYLTNGPTVSGLIEVENLVLVVLHHELQAARRPALRLAGFSGARLPWGVHWGGPDQSRFFKDLLFRPVPQARGQRLDVTRTRLLELALQLDRQLEMHARYPGLIHQPRIQLPRLWAGFRGSYATCVTGDGPELALHCRRTKRPASRLLQEAQRMYEGLAIYPLEWVSHHWPDMVAVFADLGRLPRRQVFPLRRLPDDLQGFQGAADFDLYYSRFRRCGDHLPEGQTQGEQLSATA